MDASHLKVPRTPCSTDCYRLGNVHPFTNNDHYLDWVPAHRKQFEETWQKLSLIDDFAFLTEQTFIQFLKLPDKEREDFHQCDVTQIRSQWIKKTNNVPPVTMTIATTPSGWVQQTITPGPHINVVPTLHQCHQKMHKDFGDAICGRYFESNPALLMHQQNAKEHKHIFRESSYVKSNTCPLSEKTL